MHVTMYWVSNGQSGNVGVTPEQAERIARVMAGLSTPSRIRLLSRLRQGPSTVTALAESVGMTQPAVSHQLRILRDLGLVIGRRDVRHIVYSLHNANVAALIDDDVASRDSTWAALDAPRKRDTAPVADTENDGPLDTQVYVEDRYVPFGELTSDDARRLAEKFSGLSGGGPGGRRWRPSARRGASSPNLMEESGAERVADLGAERAAELAEGLRVVPPGGGWLSS